MTRADRDHLRILSICHYVLAGLCFLFGCLPIFHLVMGIMLVTEEFGPPKQQQGMGPGPDPMPMQMLGWIFIGVAACMMLLYWALAATLAFAGQSLGERKRYTFCLIAAGLACLMQPIGTVLGVFTFIVLLRPSVSAAFEPVRDESKPDDASEHDRYHSDSPGESS